MTPDRFQFLMKNINERLTDKEMAEGWHFCSDWDGLLLHKDDPEMAACQCFDKE